MVIANHRHAPRIQVGQQRGSRIFVVAQILSFLLLASGIGLYAGDAYRKFINPNRTSEEDMGIRYPEDLITTNATADLEKQNTVPSERQENGLTLEREHFQNNDHIAESSRLEPESPVIEPLHAASTGERIEINEPVVVDHQTESLSQEGHDPSVNEASIAIEVIPEILVNQVSLDSQPIVSEEIQQIPTVEVQFEEHVANIQVVPEEFPQILGEVQQDLVIREAVHPEAEESIQFEAPSDSQQMLHPDTSTDSKHENVVPEQNQPTQEQNVPAQQPEFEVFEQPQVPQVERESNVVPHVSQQTPSIEKVIIFETQPAEPNVQILPDQPVIEDPLADLQKVHANSESGAIHSPETISEQVQQTFESVPEQQAVQDLIVENENDHSQQAVQDLIVENENDHSQQHAEEVPVEQQTDIAHQNGAEHAAIPLITIENIPQALESQEHYIPNMEEVAESNASEDLLPPEVPELPAQNQLVV